MAQPLIKTAPEFAGKADVARIRLIDLVTHSGGLYSSANDLLRWMQCHLDRFGEKDAEVRLLDHGLYLVRDGLDRVSGMEESGHMDAMGLAWVGMMPKGNRPFILQKGRKPSGHVLLHRLRPGEGRCRVHGHQQVRFRRRHGHGPGCQRADCDALAALISPLVAPTGSCA
jgi:CubicO group peptidase (beta-lactamase class C family)